MTTMATKATTAKKAKKATKATKARLPARLHHTAYVTRDLEATRKFYEEVIGLPLVATWCEKDLLFGAERTYCHLFFGLGDGGALAFFQFANREDQEQFGPKMPFTPFHHIALYVDQKTQQGIEKRLKAAGYKEPQSFVLEHGYCRSVYATDPNGMIVEFTLDHPDVERINRQRRASAHRDLKRWLGGDHTSNNTYR
jgi:catechol 2,3-dioxygenase-like lactoylglutathione lyase family enzyme